MKIFEGFQKGVDLGGWLSQGSYDREHLDSFITEKDFETIAGWGCDHVRLPIDYNIFETEEGEPIGTGFELVDKALAWGEKYKLNVLLDVHKVYGYSFYSGDGENGFFDSETLQERFYKLWERLAERYGKYPERVAFELLNEVNDKEFCEAWNRISHHAIEVVRKYAPKTKIVLGSYWNNSVDALHDLEMPYDENIVYNFHCYDPFMFTHQGATWVDEMPVELRLDYPGDINDYRRTAKETGLTRIQDYLDVPDSGFDASYFEKRFVGAVKLAEERGTALYCGEYGAIDRAAPEQILAWYKDINSAFVKFGIGRAAWNYKEKDFGLSDERMKPVIEELVKYL
ncbi:cellulase family glycosylhydrolase [Ruminococcus sp.]|uniref:glycoside hydrolase family 5 protein n=1 Tax=Ruminococcus sp. TaxID=41978 RepID=UPI0025ED61BA|nr:cellulase family glycosylhydrolase [Ruminococcus sp.]MBQ8967587.1 cellulase family glycosylhydrolase [Ruminococcus sp.]